MLGPFLLLSILVPTYAWQLPRVTFLRKAVSVLPIVSLTLAPYLVEAEPQGRLEYQPALQGLDYGKPRTFYPDFIQKDSGLQYKIVKEGNGYPNERSLPMSYFTHK